MMSGNDESTASVQPSGGSVVDGPSASTITSPSSNGGARTTASGDDSVSQPNGETQLSEQMQQLNIGRNRFIQSNQLSLPELRAYCQSDSLTQHGLRERLSHLNLQVEDSTYGILLIDVCANDCVTYEMVQCVIEHVPGAVSAVERRGVTPLHFLCSNKNVTRDIFRCVFDGNQDALLKQDEGGSTPLVYLCCNEALDETVAVEISTLLLEMCPESVKCCTHDGCLPIHFACKYRSPEFCGVLIQKFPESIQHKANGDFHLQPLHLACLHGNLPVVECILDMHPDAIRGESSDGDFPIHFAIYALRRNPQAAVEVVKFLLSVDPNVASQEGTAFPLIYACSETNELNLNAGLEVIKLLYNAYPEAIVSKEALFRRLIDISGFVDDVNYFLIDQLRYAAQASNHQLVRTQDGNGRLPLHHALLEDAPLGTIKLLVQADSSTIQTPDNHGLLPLHIACEHHDCPDVIKYLVDLNIESLLVAANWGDTPLHCACLGRRYVVIEMLLTQYPNAPVTTRNLDGDLPIQLLLDYDDQESADYASCIFLLLKASPEMWMSNENLVLALTS